ncbi:MAG: hypothetical protein QXY82_04300 [Desulfurococcaceae archaeon]
MPLQWVPGVITMLIQILTILLLVLAATRRVRGGARRRAAVARLKLSTRLDKNVISFPTKQTFEAGTVIVTGTLSRGYLYTGHWNVRWHGGKVLIEAHDLVLRDLCQKPPLVLKGGGTFTAVLPAVRITSGEFKDTLIACLNTETVNATSQVQLYYEEGFVRADAYFKPGLITTKVEWVRIPVREARERLVAEVCYEERGTSACMVLVEMDGPGTLESKIRYPVLVKVITTHIDGDGLEELVDSVKQLPQLLGVENVVLKLTIKRGFMKTITVKSPVKSYD